MLVLPLVAAAALMRLHPGPMVIALLLVLSLFLLRAPLIILARQRWVWRDAHEETALARGATLLLAVTASFAAIHILVDLPRAVWPAAIACGIGAFVLMAISVWLAVRNRQHSMLFQTVGSIGLAGSCLAVALAAGQAIPIAIWLLWGASALHGITAIPIVHARLDLRRGRQTPNLLRAGVGVAATALAAAAITLAGAVYQGVTTALVFSALVHCSEWLALRLPKARETKLTHVGLRLMTASILFTVVLFFGLRSLTAASVALP